MKKIIIALLIIAVMLTSCDSNKLFELMQGMGNNVTGNVVPQVTVTENSISTATQENELVGDMLESFNGLMEAMGTDDKKIPEESSIVIGLPDNVKEDLANLAQKKDTAEGKKIIENLNTTPYEGDKTAIENTVKLMDGLLNFALDQITGDIGENIPDEINDIIDSFKEIMVDAVVPDDASQDPENFLSQADVLAFSCVTDVITTAMQIEVPVNVDGEEGKKTILEAIGSGVENINPEIDVKGIIDTALPSLNTNISILGALGKDISSIAGIISGIIGG